MHKEEKNGLLARFAFILQKRAWEKRLKCPENFSLGLFLPLPLASGITLQRLLIPSQPQQGRSERCRSQASKCSSGLEAACVKKEKASAVDVCCAKDFKRWCVKCWKCWAGLALNGYTLPGGYAEPLDWWLAAPSGSRGALCCLGCCQQPPPRVTCIRASLLPAGTYLQTHLFRAWS